MCFMLGDCFAAQTLHGRRKQASHLSFKANPRAWCFGRLAHTQRRLQLHSPRGSQQWRAWPSIGAQSESWQGCSVLGASQILYVFLCAGLAACLLGLQTWTEHAERAASKVKPVLQHCLCLLLDETLVHAQQATADARQLHAGEQAGFQHYCLANVDNCTCPLGP